MSQILPPPPPSTPSPPADAIQLRVLKRTFLTIFLRGRRVNPEAAERAPRSISSKLGVTLIAYAAFGCLGLIFLKTPVFLLSLWLHGMTMAFVGLFIASSAGDVLFNAEEADILLHRPISPGVLLRAKVHVLWRVCGWLALAFNLVPMVAGAFVLPKGWRFPVAHAASLTVSIAFCAGLVVLAYGLVLKWIGRERLQSLMTTAQIGVSIVAVVGGQLGPRVMNMRGLNLSIADRWWVWITPPAWFAGIDEAIAGSASTRSIALAAVGIAVTAAIVRTAFGKLALSFEQGWQALNESVAKPGRTRRVRSHLRRWLDRPPLRWLFRQPAEREACLLTLAYLGRDREVKLRFYPGMAPFIVMPVILAIAMGGASAGTGAVFALAFAGVYLGVVPLSGLEILQFSQQWQAAGLLRTVPLATAAPLFHGVRKGLLLAVVAPIFVIVAVLFGTFRGWSSELCLLLPGAIAMPVFSLVPGLGGWLPLAKPPEDASRSAGRMLRMMGVMVVAMILGGISASLWQTPYFPWLLAAEFLVASATAAFMKRLIAAAGWPP